MGNRTLISGMNHYERSSQDGVREPVQVPQDSPPGTSDRWSVMFIVPSFMVVSSVIPVIRKTPMANYDYCTRVHPCRSSWNRPVVFPQRARNALWKSLPNTSINVFLW